MPVLIKSKGDYSREEVAALLESLAARIRKGRLSLTQGKNTVALELPDSVRLETEVTESAKPGRPIRREFELEFSWRVDESGAPVDQGGSRRGLTIS